MKLSNAEKLILVMLSDISEKLHIDHGIDAKLVKSAIHSDNLWGLDWKYPGLGTTDKAAPAAVDEITRILEMWSYIEEGYKELNSDEKTRVKTEADLAGPPRYTGFDRENEHEYDSIASFLIYDLKMFKKFKHDSVDSKSGRMADYKKMLKVFETIKPELGLRHLNPVQLVSILKLT